MTATQATIVAALLSSPLLLATFEWAKNKIVARFTYKGWQAIFLTNEHIYFGKVSSLSRNDLTLKDIYYLNAPNEPENPTSIPENVEMYLVKLGNELHGPKDVMVISRSAITFTENLKDGGQVVKAIMQYQKKGPKETGQ